MNRCALGTNINNKIQYTKMPPSADPTACPPTTIHVCAGVAGCSRESADALESAFARLLHALVEILHTSLPFLQSGALGGAAEARERLALAALKVRHFIYRFIPTSAPI